MTLIMEFRLPALREAGFTAIPRASRSIRSLVPSTRRRGRKAASAGPASGAGTSRNEPQRHALAIGSCSGCHGRETKTYSYDENARRSGLLRAFFHSEEFANPPTTMTEQMLLCTTSPCRGGLDGE